MLLGGRPTSTREQMRQVLELEIQLANITVPQDQRRDEEKIYHKMSIAELQVGQVGEQRQLGGTGLWSRPPSFPSCCLPKTANPFLICLLFELSSCTVTIHFRSPLSRPFLGPLFCCLGMNRGIMLKLSNNLHKMSTKQSKEIWKHLLEGPYCARNQPFSWIMERLGEGGSEGDTSYVGTLDGVKGVFFVF